MNEFLKKIFRGNYYMWMFFVLHRRLHETFKSVYIGIKKNNYSQDNLFNLRRDIHRLEKGLLFRNKKPFFAEGFVELTIDRLKSCLQSEVLDKGTKNWSVAVLNEYFGVVRKNKNIEIAFQKFSKLGLENSNPNCVPYKSLNRVKSKISYESFFDLTKKRRSVRYFLDKKVDINLIEKAVKAMLQSPSACNRQSFNLYYYTEIEQVKKITALPGGVSGYEVPSVMVITVKYDGYFEERDLFAPIIDVSISLMSFLLALETLGLSSVVINWSQNQKNNREVRHLVPIDEDEVVVMLVGVGYPDPEGLIPYSAKRDVKQVISFDKYFSKTD